MRRSHNWILRIIGFVGVILLVNALSYQLGLKYWMPRTNGRTLNVYVYQRHGIQTDVLSVGSSRILRALTPVGVEDELSGALGRPVTAYNVGPLGTRVIANSLVLKDVLASNAAPRIVVFEVSVGALHSNRRGLQDALKYYASLGDLAGSTSRWITSPGCAAAAAAGSFRGFSNLFLYGHHLLFPHGLNRGLEEILQREGGVYGAGEPPGGRLSDMTLAARQKKINYVQSQRRSWETRTGEIGGAPKQAFLRICRLVRESDAKLIVVNPPVTREFREQGYPEFLKQEYARYLMQAAGTEGFEYRDLDAEVMDLTEDDFLDFGHLNEAGSRKVSTYTAREVLLPILKRKRCQALGP
jgi:hypothetical protein